MSMLKWIVELSVDELWVADGFDLTDERAKEMLASDLSYAYGHEIEAKVIKAPAPNKIAKLQGYDNAKEMYAKNPAQYAA
jgi:hypothetical protein